MGFFSWLRRKPAPSPAARVTAKRLGLDSAGNTSLTTSFARSDYSPREIESADLASARARSRDLIRNNFLAKKAQNSWAGAVVGSGIPCRSNTGKVGVDKRVDTLFNEWSKNPEVTGIMDFFMVQLYAFKHVFADGEVFIRRIWTKGGLLPLKLQVLPPDFVALDLTDEGRNIFNGVEFDQQGVLTAYWVYKTNPLDGDGGEAFRVPAEDMIHAYDLESVGQTHGVPWLSPVTKRIYTLDDYLEAERIRKRVEASMAVIVSSPDGSTPFTEESTSDPSSDFYGLRDASGGMVTGLSPGAVLVAPPEASIDVVAPAQVWGYPDFVRTEVRAIAVGLRMPYEMLSGDLAEVNFSSIRFGMLEYRTLSRQIQRTIMGRQILRRVWQWFVQAAVASGKLPAREYPVKFVYPVTEDIDRRASAQADLEEVQSGFSSLQDILTRRGLDWREVLQEQAEAKELAESLGLNLDSINATEVASTP